MAACAAPCRARWIEAEAPRHGLARPSHGRDGCLPTARCPDRAPYRRHAPRPGPDEGRCRVPRATLRCGTLRRGWSRTRQEECQRRRLESARSPYRAKCSTASSTLRSAAARRCSSSITVASNTTPRLRRHSRLRPRSPPRRPAKRFGPGEMTTSQVRGSPLIWSQHPRNAVGRRVQLRGSPARLLDVGGFGARCVVPLVGSRSVPPHPCGSGADSRRSAAVDRRGFIGGALPVWIGTPGSAGQTPPTPIGPEERGRATGPWRCRVWTRRYRPRGAPRSLRWRVFCRFGEGFRPAPG